MRRNVRAAFLATLGSLALAACDAVRSPAAPSSGAAASSDSCTRCHGDPARNAAPPRSVRGATETSDVGVGAHQAHLTDGAIRQAVACSECHVVPSSVDSPGHMDGARAPATFGSLATAGGAKPSWNTDQLTCSSTYCHGATLAAGGTSQAPVWTRVDGTQAACGTCHGIPPTSPGHPAVTGGATACSACHPATVKPDGTIDVAGGKHIDGTVEVGGFACTSCHGDPARASAAIAPAPPRDTKGNTSTTALGVGAHQAHLNAGPLRGAVACSECHVVPSDLGHSAAAGPPPVTFGALATTGGTTPSWDRNAASCSSTYCHGAGLPGGSNTAPQWTRVDGTQATCGTCHGVPPPSPHPAVSGSTTACAGCHPGTVKPDGSIDVPGGKHINGVVDVSGGSCTSCHGDGNRTAVSGADANVKAAPPVDSHGNTATTARGVGAHQAHVNKGSGALSTPVACSECHVVPSSIPHSDGTVNVTFGTKAKTGGVSPSWNGASCSASYCHGATLTGGSNNTPIWTGGSAQAACGTCHGTPPSSGRHGNHSGRACSDCHTGTYTRTSADPTLHVNGRLEVGNRITSWNPGTGACVGCHGSATWR